MVLKLHSEVQRGLLVLVYNPLIIYANCYPFVTLNKLFYSRYTLTLSL